MFYAEKTIQHIHVKCFSESARAGYKCNIIIALPPVFYKQSFVYKETVIFSNFTEAPFWLADFPAQEREHVFL